MTLETQTQTNEPTDKSPGTDAFGSSTEGDVTYPGALSGGSLVRIKRDGAEDLWLMVYEYPPASGTYIAWQFDDKAQVEATFGPNWWESVPFVNKGENFYNNKVEVMSGASEIIGLSGDFSGFIDAAQKQAAIAAGVNDPSLYGLVANDPEWIAAVTKAALGGWTQEQLTAELRDTHLWKRVLYPGIAQLYGQTAEPEQAWLNYQRNVESSLESLGYAKDADGTYRQTIGKMLRKGISDSMFVDAVPVFVRAAESTNYFDALNQWTQTELGKTITFGDWFDVLSGEAAPDIARTFELAQLQFVSNQTGVGAGADMLRKIAQDTSLTEQQAFSVFNETERNLLALGDEALGRYGLTRDELLSAASGIPSVSGRSTESIRQLAQKAAVEAGLADDVSTQLFVGYTNRGTPERPGLKALSPERA